MGEKSKNVDTGRRIVETYSNTSSGKFPLSALCFWKPLDGSATVFGGLDGSWSIKDLKTFFSKSDEQH